jgi:hypothetical protein
VLVGAILVVGSLGLDGSAGIDGARSREFIAGSPLSCFDVLGESVLQRTVQSLKRNGVWPIRVIATEDLPVSAPSDDVEFTLAPHPLDIWFAVEHLWSQFVDQGVEIVMVSRLGPYVEFTLASLVRFLRENGHRAVRLADRQGPLDFWMFDALQAPVTGTMTLREMVQLRLPTFRLRSYVNRLQNAHDLRQLVVDAFSSRCAIRPEGDETRPGVWVDRGAQIDRRSRIVPPAYIGRNTSVRSATLVTRFSNIERQCHIDCGTVVENSTILANTHLGSWLDVSHAVVSGSVLVHLRRNVEVEIHDPILLKASSAADAGSRRDVGAATSVRKQRFEDLADRTWKT